MRKIYRKSPPWAVVGLPMAPSFKECVALDLKFYNDEILFHLMDHATRLSASCFAQYKSNC